MTRYDVTTMAMGESIIPGPELFWMNNFEEWFPLTFQSVLIRGNGVVAIVNTGPALDLEPMNAGWASFLGEKARLSRGDGDFILDQLAANDVKPEDVTHVILTPLQLYTVSNVLAFPDAEICIARRGWVHFHTTHDHPHDNRSTSIPDEILTELVTTAWPRVRLLDDEDEIAPGLRTWWAGGHHRASIVVEVDTANGVVAISDSYFHARNVVENIPLGINENMYEILACYERVRRTADIILPLYDPANFERHPRGRVAAGE
jgi:glyoxylase-like metal-dependent hydrolase (beta-lactamase superfamily II)